MRSTAAFLGLFFFLAGWVHAQEEGVFRHPLNPQTEAAFRAACRRLSGHPLVRGNFEQERTFSRLNRSLKSSGNFLIAENLGMAWDTENPFPSTLVLGRDYFIQSRPGGQRTFLSAQGNETFLHMADAISTMFSGNAQGLLDNFEIFYAETSASWELGLKPLDNAINSFAQRIIMRGDTVIRFIQVIEQNNDAITYVLSNYNFPAELSVRERALFTVP